jgi:hypothetical protein
VVITTSGSEWAAPADGNGADDREGEGATRSRGDSWLRARSCGPQAATPTCALCKIPGCPAMGRAFMIACTLIGRSVHPTNGGDVISLHVPLLDAGKITMGGGTLCSSGWSQSSAIAMHRHRSGSAA